MTRKTDYFKLIVILCICSVCFLNCRKYRFIFSTIQSEKKDVFYADSGSYWIFSKIDSFGHKSIDSWFVKSIKKMEERRVYQTYTETTEYVTIEFNNNLGIKLQGGGYVYLDFVRIDTPRFNETIWTFINSDKFKIGNSYNYSRIDSIFSSYSLNGNTFGETRVWRVKPDYVLQSKETIYYFAKGVGIIKILDKERKTEMNLIRYKYKRIVD